MSQWFKIKAASKGAAEISIFDQIGVDDETGNGVSAKAFDTDLKALGNPKSIVLRINSPGGDVMQGMAIYSMLQNSRAKITARIEGIAASAASLIAMAADRIEIHSNAFMLIHQPYTVASGNAEDLTIAAGDLERMTAQYVAIYAKKSGKPEADVLSLMKEDRLMTAEEAVTFGLCDAVIDPSTEKVNLKQVPKPFLAAVEAAVTEVSTMTAAKPARKTLGLTAEEIKALRAILAKAAKAEDDDEDANARADGSSDDGDENDEAPSNAKKAKARKAKAADDDADASAEDDDDMNARAEDGDDDDKPAARKAKASSGIEYAAKVADLCTIAGKADMIAGFIANRTPLADISKKLLKARAESEETISQARREKHIVAKADEIAKGWDAAIAKLKR